MKKLCFSLLFLLAISTSVFAVDDVIFDVPGGENDPAINEEANACFSSGSLAGKCSSTDVDMDGDVDDIDRVWMWNAGWHLIRFEVALIKRENFEPYYITILPAEFEDALSESMPTISSPPGGCRRANAFAYASFGNNNFLPIGAPAYNDATCTTMLAGTWFDIVYTPSGAVIALSICNMHGSFSSVSMSAGDNVYTCQL